MNASSLQSILTDRSPRGTQGYHDKLQAVTGMVISQTFFGTMLKQVRESPFRSEIFDGGRGGQAFGAMFDEHIAEHMARGSGSKLVNAMVRRLEGNRAYEKFSKKSVRSNRKPGARK